MAERYRVTLCAGDFEATLFFDDFSARNDMASDMGRAMRCGDEIVDFTDDVGTRVLVRGKDISGVVVENT